MIKQTKKTTISLLLLSLVTSIFSVVVSPQTSYAYKCVGTPDDYYTRDVGSREGFGDKAQITQGARRDAANSSFKWDESLGRCTVTIPDVDNQRESKNVDGSFAGCNANEQRVSTSNNCAPMVTYATNDKPVNNDGTPLDKSKMTCGSGDEYDEESFSCKQTGTVCNATGTCDYNKVGLTEDKTTATPPVDPNKNLNYCDKTYVSSGLDNQTANRQACIAGQQGKDCAATYAASNQAEQKKACESGKANPSSTPPLNGMPAGGTSSGDAGTCGEAKTNLISCDGSAGVPALASVLKIILFILTILIGIVATGGIVYGAILYASAQDNASQVGQAKTIIRDVAIGLLLYGFMVAIVNWLIPGGVIG